MTAPSPGVQEHPDYPFRPQEAGAIRSAAAQYLGAPDAGTWEGAVLSAFVALGRRFAFLERLIQGDVVCNLPFHTDAVKDGSDDMPESQGERLAEGERALLNWETGAAGELHSVLDGIGIKVLSPMQQAVDASSDLSGRSAPLFGAFSFEEGVGPSLLTGRPLDQPEAGFVLAHEFGHLVADFNPYRSRFCRWEPFSLRNLADTPEERRADRFARALLMPQAQFRSVLAELEKVQLEAGGLSAAPGPVAQLAAIFEVPAPLACLRLEDLGLSRLIPSGRPWAEGPARTGESCGHPGTGDHTCTECSGQPEQLPLEDQVSISCLALPERYVNLCLAAFTAKILKPATLAAFLDTTRVHAMRIVSWANLPVSDVDEGQ